MYAIIFLFLSSFSVGKIILSKLTLFNKIEFEKCIVSISLGLSLWCFLLFFLGHFRLLNRWFLLSIAFFSSIPSLFIFFSTLKSILGFRSLSSATACYVFKTWINKFSIKNLSIFEKLIIPFLIAILTITFISCFAPVVGGIRNDEIGIHISVPKDWLSFGGITMLPYQVSHLAGHCELLFLFAHCFFPEYGPKIISWIFMILCTLLIYGFAKDLFNRRSALIACSIFLINPLIFRTSFIGFIDLPASFFIVLSLRLLFIYKDSRNIRYIYLASFFLGTGCGLKPTAYFYLPAFLIIFVLIMYSCHKERLLKIMRKMVSVVVLIAIFGSCWPMRNLILTGSPTFPPLLVLYKLNNNSPIYFSGKPFTFEMAEEFADYYPSRVKPYGLGIYNFFLLPWNITMHPESFSIGDSIGTIMLSLLPLAFFLFKRCMWFWLIIGYCGISITVIYFGIIPEARYLIPVYMLCSIIAAQVIVKLSTIKNTIIPVFAVLLINMLFALAICIRICQQKIKTVLSPSFRYEYKQKNIPFYEAFEFLNKDRKSPLIVFYGNQIFYYLKSDYIIDANTHEYLEKYKDAYILDIDYSQTLERNFDIQKNDFYLSEIPPQLDLVFNSQDARIYRIKKNH